MIVFDMVIDYLTDKGLSGARKDRVLGPNRIAIYELCHGGTYVDVWTRNNDDTIVVSHADYDSNAYSNINFKISDPDFNIHNIFTLVDTLLYSKLKMEELTDS